MSMISGNSDAGQGADHASAPPHDTGAPAEAQQQVQDQGQQVQGQQVQDQGVQDQGGQDQGQADGQEKPAPPQFILYLDGPEYQQTLYQLMQWTHHVLLPVYGREVTSTAPWCSRWWEHPEAVAQLHGLWLAWAELTGPNSDMAGPAMWHRDFLGPVMGALRDPMGPFAGCKPGGHRPKEVPPVDTLG